MTFEHFEALSPESITADNIATLYGDVLAQFDRADSLDELVAAVERWDGLRKRLETWRSLVRLHFRQDTRDADNKAANTLCDELSPKVIDMDVQIKRRLLASDHRAALEARFGEHLFALWTCDVSAFAPEIQDDMVHEAKLKAAYTELRASAKLEFQGEQHTLSGIGRFALDEDRAVRQGAAQVKWQWYADHGAEFDQIFHDLVQVRHKMATALGCENFVDLGYRWMQRIDYNKADVERFRAQVRDHLVPLVADLRKQQAESLGLDGLSFWDEAVLEQGELPSPGGDTDWVVARGREVFEALGEEPAAFYKQLTEGGLLDLDTRDGKAGGAFCTAFPTENVPFVFANFNGTMDDIRTFIHELGHAFQFWSSREAPVSEYLWPTYESCEIHSMGLEFLAHPYVDRFFGADAERFRKMHLIKSLMFIPYGVAVDHFQHMVYENPEATPEARRKMWQEIEATYLPWRDYGDLQWPGAGGLWQQQLHIYQAPFYYIDYTLAMTCALQFWLRSQESFDDTVKAYVDLCKRGGEAPFQDLTRSAGLTSPFDPGCLEQVVDRARATLA